MAAELGAAGLAGLGQVSRGKQEGLGAAGVPGGAIECSRWLPSKTARRYRSGGAASGV